MNDVGIRSIVRAVNDGRLYRKVGDDRIEAVNVRLLGGVVAVGSPIRWPFRGRPLRCDPVTDRDLRNIRLRKGMQCLTAACCFLGAVGCWVWF